MQGMTNAEAVQMTAIMFVIGTVAMLLLVLGAVFLPEVQRGAATVATWASERSASGKLISHELGMPERPFREPADPSYVDELIRVRGVAMVMHNPSPQPVDIPAPAEPVSPYRVTLADLVEGSRYVVPIPVSPALPPALPVPHYASGIVRTPAHAEHVGAHRARELVAA